MKLLNEVYRQAFVVVFLVYCNYTNTSGDENCEGRVDGCCDGFVLNVTSGKCTECRAGYTGTDCSTQCPYPSYGKSCQMLCDCQKALCNFALGCEVDNPGNNLTTFPVNRTSEQAKIENQKEKKDSKKELLKYILFAAVFLTGLIIIAHVAFYISERKQQ